MSRHTYDHMMKLLLIGDASTGKTSLLLNFCDNKFNSSLMSTIGIDFKIKTITVQGKRIKLQIWDTAGQEKYHTITTAYYRGSHGIMMLYDITNIQSFDNIARWMQNTTENAGEDTVKMIVANKIDKEEQRLISRNRGNDLAMQYDVDFMETSAKTGANVQEAFERLVERALVVVEAEKEANDLTLSGRKGPFGPFDLTKIVKFLTLRPLKP